MTATLGDVLRYAADNLLSPDHRILHQIQPWTCNVAHFAAIRLDSQYDTGAFLSSLGCPEGPGAAFGEYMEGPSRQAVRFLWLHFAAEFADSMSVRELNEFLIE